MSSQRKVLIRILALLQRKTLLETKNRTLKNWKPEVEFFLSFSARTHKIPTVEGERIRCVRRKRSIKTNIELLVAIHEVCDGQRSCCLL